MASTNERTNRNSFYSILINYVVRPHQFILCLVIGIAFTGAFIVASAFSVVGQMTDNKPIKMDKNEQAVMAVANDFFNAAVKQDANAMERLLDDDYLQVFSPRGTVVTKSELVNGYKNATPGNLETEGVDITSPKVRIYGDTAILVSGFTIRSKSADGKSVNRDFSGTMVLVKKKGQWKVASTHGSYIPPVPTATNSSNEMKNTEQGIMALAGEFANATVKRDATAMERLLADNFIQVFPNGVLYDKTHYINLYKTPAPENSGTLNTPEISSPKISMFGDTAIMTARVTTSGKNSKGETTSGDFLYTMTAVEKGGQWQIAGLQSIEIPSKIPPAGMGNHCKFDKGPRAGEIQDYSTMKPYPLGSPCYDGKGSTGKFVAA